MTDTHRATALAFLEDAHAAMARLDKLVESHHSDNRSSSIAAEHQAIGRALKLAQIHSNLAIAESMAAKPMPPNYLTSDEIRNLMAEGDRMAGR